jgi:4-amino-4-deoxy-L-arabinose transferase-like glycosyltransferase
MAVAAETHDRVAVNATARLSRVGSAGLLAAIVAISAWLYGHRLEYAPPHLEIDEVLIALDAHAIASTGRDLRGELLPLYSQTAEHSWYQPFVIYVTALAFTVLPLAEWAVRVPTVCIAVLDIALMFLVARRLVSSVAVAAIAAGMLALSPAHFIHTRYGMDYIYPVPFILGWLLCLVRYDQDRRPWLLVAGASILGVGFYSYIASIVMMPVYFALTCLVLRLHRAPVRRYAQAAAGFLPWLVPFLVWLGRHPAAYAATIDKYGLYDAHQLNAAQGLRSIVGFTSVSQRLSQYWNFYNPSFLFFGSGTKVMFSTNLAGVFLLPLALFLAVGIHRALRERTPIDLVLVIGFLTAPLAALIVEEEHAIFRALALLPFGVLLATLGFDYLWSASETKPFSPMYAPLGIAAAAGGAAYAAWTLLTQGSLTRSSLPLLILGLGILAAGRAAGRTTQWRIAAVCLLALMPLQFRSFWSDYFSDYRVRSAFWLGGNIRGALEELIADAGPQTPAVYFSTLKSASGQEDGRNQYMSAYWQFYLKKHHRDDLLARTKRFAPDAVETTAAGSLVLANVGDPGIEALVGHGQLRPLKTIAELDGRTFFRILQR